MTQINGGLIAQQMLSAIKAKNQQKYGPGGLTLSEIPKTSPEFLREIRMYKSTEDSLALSCTLKRLREQKTLMLGGGDLKDETLYRECNADDRALADTIRNYYQQRIVYWKLQSKELSKFRTDLEQYIVGNGKQYEHEQIGMITRLPHFYQYDISVEQLRDEHFDSTTSLVKRCEGVFTLIPIRSLDRKTARSNKRNYWFKTTDNIGVMYSVDRNNLLLQYFDSIFEMKRPMCLSATLLPSEREGFMHYHLERLHSAILSE